MNAIISMILSVILSLNVYPMCLVVTELDYENEQVVFENSTGFEYRNDDGIEDQAVGDLFAAIMWNNNTPWTIEDDVIIFAHYSSFSVKGY